jgi:phosphoserine phosphatase RsbU/P
MQNNSNSAEKELFLKNLEVSSLLEVTQAINNNIPEDELYKVFKFTIQSHINIEKALLYVVDIDSWEIKVEINSPLLQENQLISLLEIINKTIKEPVDISTLSEFDFLIPVNHKEKLLAVFLLKFRDTSPFKNISFFNVLTNIIIVAIENKKMARERLKQEALKKELEIAKHVQRQLFPKNLPYNNKLKTFATYIPHDQIGGDYYDFIQINENEFIFCIADVSGKGIPAALLMSNFQASLRILALFETNLPELVDMLNKFVKLNANGEKFITLFIGKYNFEKEELEFINAGHNLPILYANNECVMLEEGTTLLGVFDELPFLNIGKVTIPSMSHLFLYTDGLSEIKNDEDVEIELDFIKKLLVQKLDLEVLHKEIITYIDIYKENQNYVDDISMFSLFFE